MCQPVPPAGSRIDAPAATAALVDSSRGADDGQQATNRPAVSDAASDASPREDAIAPVPTNSSAIAADDIETGQTAAGVVDPTVSDVQEDDDSLGLSRGDALIGGALAIALLVLSVVHWAQLTGWGGRVVGIDRAAERTFETRLDLNSSTWVELAELDSVGEVLARRIVEHREKNGPYRSVDQLRRVSGVGAKTLEKIRPWVKIETSPESTTEPEESR